MTEILQANLFFFITSVAVVVFTVFLCVALYYVIIILRTVGNITKRIEEGSETIAEDVKHLRSYLAQGSLISQVIGLFVKSKRGRHKKEVDEDV